MKERDRKKLNNDSFTYILLLSLRLTDLVIALVLD